MMTTLWINDLNAALSKQVGKKLAPTLSEKYVKCFSNSYQDGNNPSIAVDDITAMEELGANVPLITRFYYSQDPVNHFLHLRLLQWKSPIPLCDILPMLENLDLRAYNEQPYQIILNNHDTVYISDFTVVYAKETIEPTKVQELFQDAFTSIHLGLTENDPFNKLILGALLSWRDIVILRAYTKYLRQTQFRFSQDYIEKTLVKHTAIAKLLINLFMAMHKPGHQNKAKSQTSFIENDIIKALESVTSLDEDRIIRRLLDLIKATLRTNYFQTTADGKSKDYLSFKFKSSCIPELPLPIPLYEVFVYSTKFEAIHLRSAKVARGGIRWSDRREDFRTEVLGLMKAQKVKNAVIVPSGAKGGFVLKIPTSKENVIDCYQSFIRGLLDITDNIKNKKIIKPNDVICYDEDDPYLVVAADKGTASFSDIANAISLQFKFWLGDAFASGGSAGYDHKKMGITARGAWESGKRHFRELNIDLTKTAITVVGIGDMSGDVFGNGAIYSNNIKLVAAFDHRHIFIDPNPSPASSYAERVRLFKLPTSSWADYNSKLISKGGGVFSRASKSIDLTSEMKEILQIEDNSLAPNDLIRAILQAPVDLLFNGGIGTYVKATQESHADVGDRTNEYCRVNGNELRCKVVVEGGNLGFTQLGRIEYALTGGLINTDFIDNSAGVDCSDHEVNLKILLDNQIHLNKLTYDKRNVILTSLTQEVAALVLKDNFYQALVMSFTAFHAQNNISLHANYIKELESLGILNRKIEFLPTDKILLDRKASHQGLTRPELAVLLAYTKIYIKNELLKSNLPEDKFLSQFVITAFPPSIRNKYLFEMDDHLLHRDIIATQLSNHLVNEMGTTFVYRVQIETGATVEEIVKAYTIASTIFRTGELKTLIETLDYKIPLEQQYQMLYNLRHLINLSTRWFLQKGHQHKDIQTTVEHYRSRILLLEKLVPDLMGGNTKHYLESLTSDFFKAGLPKEHAQRIATYRAIYTLLNVILVATDNKFDLMKTAHIYFTAGERVKLLWFRDEIAKDSRDGHWNVLARLTIRDELDNSQRALTISIMKNGRKNLTPDLLINQWIEKNSRGIERWERLLSMLCSKPDLDYTSFFIAIRELQSLLV